MNISDDLSIAIDSAKKAGEIVRNGWGNFKEVNIKKDKGFVTEVDKNSEKTIIDTLKSLSKYPILSEETNSQIEEQNTFWAVDPLDGTTNFTLGIPQIGISIALIREKEPVLGVVYNPITEEMFFGEVGLGAFFNNQPITVSSKKELYGSTLFLNYGYAVMDKEIWGKYVGQFCQIANIRKFGTTAMEICYIAKGSAEVFISSGDELWDYAAGLAIVKSAGGKISDWNGKHWNNRGSFIMATNGLVDPEVINVVGKYQTA